MGRVSEWMRPSNQQQQQHSRNCAGASQSWVAPDMPPAQQPSMSGINHITDK
jgi:hypothetical protein